MFDFEIARYLYWAAFLHDFLGNTHKSRAYYKAAMAVDGYSTDIEKLFYEGKLQSLPSVGVSIEKNIIEIIKTGHLKLINELLGDIPDSIFELYEYANVKDKLFKTLINNKIFNFAHISDILKQNVTYLSLSGRDDLKLALKSYRTHRFQYAQVFELANELMTLLRKSQLVKDINVSNDLYLHRESMTLSDIICTLASDFSNFLHYIQTLPSFKFILTENNDVTLERYGIPFKIHVLSESEFDSKIQELQIEKENYALSHSGETVSQFYGDLHLHTDWSDGLHSIKQMCDMAVKLGYSYIAITDHSQSLRPSGMSELDTLTQIKKIREMNVKSIIPILAGIEVDILADGSLDLPDKILKEFDIVIASVHSHFNQPPFVLNERLAKALSNKYVNILAHPTGRLLGRPGKPTVGRNEMELDFDDLIKLCRSNNVALEINCFPERFDLSLDKAKQAVTEGVKITIGTDSHSMYHMSCAKYALESLKFANIPAEAVLNCQPPDELKRFLGAKRGIDDDNITSIFEENFKDFHHYFSDNNGIVSSHIKAVGIDLTASEKKASGFAVLSGSAAKTFTVLTDDEIVKHISDIKPDIVSIDSPLSLPEGRCCGDKNCECAKYGIMRYCELILRHFGIGVYPCLIDSMVNLTMRGMKLALRLRSLGFAVIESYPGVAQDLLHIPRKRKGLELLLNGMKNFGIEGIRKGITHDEADAITSALVGYFYLDNRYTGIGKKKENDLIVPKLETSLSGRGIVIGLVGHIASGKTTAAEYLRFRYGFASMRFSELIEKEYNVFGRENLQKTGSEIAKDPEKQKRLSDIMISGIKDGENYVIDGIRQEIDYNNLASTLGNRFTLVSVDAPSSARMNRYCRDNPDKSPVDFKNYDGHEVESPIDKISYKSNNRVMNNKGYKEFMGKFDTLLLKVGG
jgi:histidinol phosphatase-like PHP family hydrolase/predicted nuclease with RNAse H fold/dephospho-CoA kinase